MLFYPKKFNFELEAFGPVLNRLIPYTTCV